MSLAVAFWQVLGLEITYGGPTAPFTSLIFGSNFVNLQLVDQSNGDIRPRAWGRVVFHVDSPDEIWNRFTSAGYEAETEPNNASWGERFFHIVDPDGHELSFARPLGQDEAGRA